MIAARSATDPYYNGGLLALATNSGTFVHDSFTTVPQLELNLGYQIDLPLERPRRIRPALLGNGSRRPTRSAWISIPSNVPLWLPGREQVSRFFPTRRVVSGPKASTWEPSSVLTLFTPIARGDKKLTILAGTM